MTEEEGAVYGRLQDAWLEMCTTYLEMVGDLSSSSGKEDRVGQEWEGKESLAGILGHLDEKDVDKKSVPKRKTYLSEVDDIEKTSCEIEDTSCETGEKEMSRSNSVSATKETRDEVKDEATGEANAPSPINEEDVEHCSEAKYEPSLEKETQEEPDIEDIVDAKDVPEKDHRLTDGNSAEDQIKLPNVSGKGSLAKEGEAQSLTSKQEEEEVDIMSERDKVVRSDVEKDKTDSEEDINKEKDIEKHINDTSEDDAIEQDVEKCDNQDTDVPNTEAGQNDEEEEHIVEDEKDLSEKEKEEPETAATDPPFSFSDFARQPNRPDSPNMSEGSDPEEGGGGNQEEKKSEESQKETLDEGSPTKREVKNDHMKWIQCTLFLGQHGII